MTLLNIVVVLGALCLMPVIFQQFNMLRTYTQTNSTNGKIIYGQALTKVSTIQGSGD